MSVCSVWGDNVWCSGCQCVGSVWDDSVGSMWAGSVGSVRGVSV